MSYFNYINPIVATFLGVLILSEPFKWLYVGGLLLIFTGLFFMNSASVIKLFKRKTPAVEPAVEEV